MYYIVDSGSAYPGTPNVDANGRLTLPNGNTLEKGKGYRTITVHEGEPNAARRQVTETAQESADRRRRGQ